MSQGPIDSSLLKPFGSEEQTEFKRKVFDAQLHHSMSSGKREPAPEKIPDEELQTIEEHHKQREAPAQAAREMLAAARAALKEQQEAGNENALKVNSIGLVSAYRSLEHDLALWDGYFEKYYHATDGERAALDGGPHGEKAIAHLAHFIGGKKAMPGFSNHSHGVALDLATHEGGKDYGANSHQHDEWKKTWLYKWLVENAGNFSYKPYEAEPWHWDHSPA